MIFYLWWRDPKGMVILGGFVQAATLPIIAGATLYLRYRRTDRASGAVEAVGRVPVVRAS